MDRTQPETKPEMQHYDSSIVAEAIKATKQAEKLKEAAIEELLSLRGQIDADLKTLGYEAQIRLSDRTGAVHRTTADRTSEPEPKRAAGPKPFRDIDLASVVRIILSEHDGGPMHGKEIETIARAGGYEKGGEHWQGYLSIALKRAGGIENIGLNRWRLNDQIAPIPIGRRQK